MSVAKNVDVVDDYIDDPKTLEGSLNENFPKVRFTLMDPAGPGGGAPVFRIDGSRDAVRETLEAIGCDDVDELIEPDLDGPDDNWGGW